MRHLQKDIEKLKLELLALGGRVEENFFRAVEAVQHRDSREADQIIQTDFVIDHLEVDLEDRALKILALNQPVAVDLRLIISILKINSDLERIGDLCANIAERARYLSSHPPVQTPFDFADMSRETRRMLKASLDALVNFDSDLAREVLEMDDTVDHMNRDVFRLVERAVRRNPDEIDRLLHILSVSRHIERAADHATSIAEDVIYLVDGEIVRHQHEEYRHAPLRF